MSKGPQGRRRARPYILVAGVLALTNSLYGPSIQAWYRTMSPAMAAAIGASIILGGLALGTLGALFFISRNPDA